jgi:hypothetical protein
MSRDLRSYHRQTTFRLIIGGIILLFIVGDGLIYLIYGPGAAVTGFLCLGTGLIPVGLTILALELLGWLARKIDRD